MAEATCSRCHGTGKTRVSRRLGQALGCLLHEPMSTRAIVGAFPGRISLPNLNALLHRLSVLGLAERVELDEGGYAWRRR